MPPALVGRPPAVETQMKDIRKLSLQKDNKTDLVYQHRRHLQKLADAFCFGVRISNSRLLMWERMMRTFSSCSLHSALSTAASTCSLKGNSIFPGKFHANIIRFDRA